MTMQDMNVDGCTRWPGCNHVCIPLDPAKPECRLLHLKSHVIPPLLGDVRHELIRAMCKHPKPLNEPFRACSVITEEIGEFARAANDGKREEMRGELIQVAAMALRAIIDLELKV